MYANYEFYTEQFGGNAIPQAAFNRLAARASKFLGQVTFNRITDVTDDIMMVCCEITEIYYRAAEHDGKEIASENVGGNSVSYVQTGKSLDRKCYDIASLYLSNTGLLYRGV